MGCTVTITTLRKLFQHSLRVGGPVARKTGWYDLMTILMAISASKIVVLGLILCKEVGCLLMAGPTIMRRGVLAVSYDERHMHGMAGLAACKILVLGVFFMALHAARDLSVGRMTLAASHIRMSARMPSHLITLLLVTCKARTGDLTLQD